MKMLKRAGGGRGWGSEILCVLTPGALKNRPVKGEGVKAGCRTKGLIT